MASLGELERSVMEVLWTSDVALTANEMRDALALRDDAARMVATTTVLTVLSRLERKGFVANGERVAQLVRGERGVGRPEHLHHGALQLAKTRHASRLPPSARMFYAS